ncbi:hypothetical protein EDD15DRAFT_1522987 [Pisolithus albus]|nr:hypothetical protein EDD15DRAFT_1522987 [Pisolithus albus]
MNGMEVRKSMVLNSSAKKAATTAGEKGKDNSGSNGPRNDKSECQRQERGHARVGAGGPTANSTHPRAKGSVKSLAEADIVHERASLLAERQQLLDQVLDKHDDLVREKFHLENFVTLLGYDPALAKHDDSVVFREVCVCFSTTVIYTCSIDFYRLVQRKVRPCGASCYRSRTL